MPICSKSFAASAICSFIFSGSARASMPGILASAAASKLPEPSKRPFAASRMASPPPGAPPGMSWAMASAMFFWKPSGSLIIISICLPNSFPNSDPASLNASMPCFMTALSAAGSWKASLLRSSSTWSPTPGMALRSGLFEIVSRRSAGSSMIARISSLSMSWSQNSPMPANMSPAPPDPRPASGFAPPSWSDAASWLSLPKSEPSAASLASSSRIFPIFFSSLFRFRFTQGFCADAHATKAATPRNRRTMLQSGE
mmetsp:Transcript_825/g.2776  ORF Transcript_825/g.2776 Transcript_825/m.2776 type:complete len:256 (-) Transcript_825:40-807(-)